MMSKFKDEAERLRVRAKFSDMPDVGQAEIEAALTAARRAGWNERGEADVEAAFREYMGSGSINQSIEAIRRLRLEESDDDPRTSTEELQRSDLE